MPLWKYKYFLTVELWGIILVFFPDSRWSLLCFVHNYSGICVFASHASCIWFPLDDYARLLSLLFREKRLGIFIVKVKGKNKDLANNWLVGVIKTQLHFLVMIYTQEFPQSGKGKVVANISNISNAQHYSSTKIPGNFSLYNL